MAEDATSPYMLPPDSGVSTRLQTLAGTQRLVFFAGLPGVGKSLLIRELAHMAHALGRRVHLLQWDVARYGVKTEAVIAKYPDVTGLTHAVIRKAVGLWSRSAVAQWNAANPDEADLIIGETPLIGNRLIELAVPMSDDAEPLLQAQNTSFLVPLPSKEVRHAIEGARAASTASPRHERERGDARPSVMHAIWKELRQTATSMGIGNAHSKNYDPDTYQDVYMNVLKHRKPEILPMDVVLTPTNQSVYDFQMPTHDLSPTETEGLAFIEQVERLYPDLAVLDEEVARWYVV